MELFIPFLVSLQELTTRRIPLATCRAHRCCAQIDTKTYQSWYANLSLKSRPMSRSMFYLKGKFAAEQPTVAFAAMRLAKAAAIGCSQP